MYAHLFREVGGKWILAITDDASLRGVDMSTAEKFEVSGKREARQIAAKLEATCWNF